MRFGFPLLEESQLLAKEQILRRQGTAALRYQTNEGTEIQQDQRCRTKAMPQSGAEPEWRNVHERLGCHFTGGHGA